MLRGISIFAGSLVVLLAAFGVYWYFTPAVAATKTVTVVHIPPPAKTGDSTDGFGPTGRPWINRYDKGRLVSQFNATELIPQKDGRILADRPVSVFYLTNGQWILLTGDKGVVDPEPGRTPGKGVALATPTESPKSGRLHAVEIKLFPDRDATTPSLWMTTDNIRFDGDLLQFFTEPYTDAAGVTVPADQVPVTVRGVDYEFDGKGLTVQWNAKDEKLQRLTIAHGDRLVLKNPGRVAAPGGTASVDAHALLGGRPGAWVADDNRRLRPAPRAVVKTDGPVFLSGPPPVKPPRKVGLYHALFSDQVRVYQSDRLMAVADTLAFDFLDVGGGDEDKNKPAPDRRPLPPPTADVAPAPARQSMAQPPGTTRPTTGPTSAPTTGPAGPRPVTVRWTGPLVVEMQSTPPMMPIVPGQSVVRFEGKPAVLTPEGSTVKAASLTYRTGDDAFVADRSDAFKSVDLRQDRGLHLVTDKIDYDPLTAVASIYGPSELTVPQGNNADKPMTVTWSRRADLRVFVRDRQPVGVDRVDVSDDVEVDHPQMSLTARQLRLDLRHVFDGKKDADQLQTVVATGAVRSKFKPKPATRPVALVATRPSTNPAAKPQAAQGIDADRLRVDVETKPDGNSVPRVVTADGSVHGYDGDQVVTSDHLVARLVDRPTTQPGDQSLDIASADATGTVHATMKESHASADAMRVSTTDAGKVVELWGDHGATVDNGHGKTITGSVIHVTPDRSVATVDGPGTIHSAADPADRPGPTDNRGPTSKPDPAGKAGPTTRPVDVSWTDSMSIDARANSADVVGGVVVKATAADGTVDVFYGDRCHLDLIDVPDHKDQKTVSKVTMLGHVRGESVLVVDGQVVRQGTLMDCERLIYTAADGHAEIPGPGRMVVENHTAGESRRGTMAVRWVDKLTYDDAAQVIHILGRTRTAFQPDQETKDPAKKATGPMRLDADELVITLRKKTTATTQQSGAQLSRIVATGSVHFTDDAADLTCRSLDFDAVSGRLKARGTDVQPGHAMSADGKAMGSVDGNFDELVFDTTTQDLISFHGVGGAVRK